MCKLMPGSATHLTRTRVSIPVVTSLSSMLTAIADVSAELAMPSSGEISINHPVGRVTDGRCHRYATDVRRTVTMQSGRGKINENT